MSSEMDRLVRGSAGVRPPAEDAEAAYAAEEAARMQDGAGSAKYRVRQYLTDKALEQAGRTREDLAPPDFDGGARQTHRTGPDANTWFRAVVRASQREPRPEDFID